MKRHSLLLVLLMPSLLCAQVPYAIQQRLDSLNVLLATSISDTARMRVYAEIAAAYTPYQMDSAIAVLERAIALAERTDDTRWLLEYNSYMVEPLYARGELWRSMRHAYEAERLLLALGDSTQLPGLYNAMGNNLKRQGAWKQAMRYYRMNQGLASRLGQTNYLAYSHMNMGQCFLALGQLDSSLISCRRAVQLMDSIRLGYKGTVFGTMADVYDQLDDRVNEIHYARQAVATGYAERGESRELPGLLIILAKAHMHNGQLDSAVHFARKGYVLARRIPVILSQRASAALLAECFERQGRIDSAFRYQKILSAVKDSIDASAHLIDAQTLTARVEATSDSLKNAAHLREMQLLSEREMQKERTRRNIFLFAGLGLLIFGVVVHRQRHRTQQALQRSDELLLNILPAEVAEELKTKGHADAKHFDRVTILVTDFKGFTQLSEKVTPAELVEELNACFKVFDLIMQKYRIEKIKTIGDAYMAAGGLPDPEHGSPADVVQAALEMQDFMQRHKAEREAAGKPYFEMRVGVHSGPVVAGIVGVKKFQYDIWGDTVNTASRMESSGEVGQVNISEATYALVKDARERVEDMEAKAPAGADNTQHATRQHATPFAFTFTPRGKVQAKGKGEMEMYFASRA